MITIFKETNDLLRNEGLREGVERFSEFSNILFLKLIDEIEDDRELRGEKDDLIKNTLGVHFLKMQKICWII
ncbi:hypothetical protein OFS03_09300 [Brachyspira hyodysenteriae]|nr:hypothetical protein [Brachyspira hyodysenteriae]MDA0063406.1 hypothetical protein [Brachyspira hyodysenteriae]